MLACQTWRPEGHLSPFGSRVPIRTRVTEVEMTRKYGAA